METSRLRGMGVALTTPFKSDESIDYDALDFHIDYLVESGADYIVARSEERRVGKECRL